MSLLPRLLLLRSRPLFLCPHPLVKYHLCRFLTPRFLSLIILMCCCLRSVFSRFLCPLHPSLFVGMRAAGKDVNIVYSRKFISGDFREVYGK